MTKPNLNHKSSVAKKSGDKGTAAAADAGAGAGVAVHVGDTAQGGAAIQRVQAVLTAIPAAEVVLPTLNLRLAALAALGVYRLIEQRGLIPRLEALAGVGEFELTQLQLLPDLAQATYHLRLKVEQETAVASEALVPAALAARGQTQRRRMMKLLEFHFDEDQQVAPRLAFIRSGTGHHDLAGDLVALGDLYREHETTLQQTTTHYRATDAADATAIAAELVTWLSGSVAGTPGSAELESYGNLANRAGYLLVRAYDEVAAAARYLCRKDPALVARFQSLYALARSRSGGAGEEDPGAPEPAADDQDGEAPRPTT